MTQDCTRVVDTYSAASVEPLILLLYPQKPTNVPYIKAVSHTSSVP
jgi:hypothetical protein